jgi:hypothetical protein
MDLHDELRNLSNQVDGQQQTYQKPLDRSIENGGMMPRSLRDYADSKFSLLPVKPVAAGSITLLGCGFYHR